MLRRLVADWGAAAGLPAELAEDLELALGEAGANAAEHAYPAAEAGEFDYTVARRADGDIDVAVRDHGRWRPVPVDNGHRGHGLRVIGAVAADLQIDRGSDGTDVRFRLPVPAPESPSASTRARSADRPVGEPASLRTVADRIVVTGDVDLDGRDAIGPALLGAAAGPGPWVVDLTAVRYLSSAGVALLVEATALAGPRLSIVVAPGSAPARVCGLVGLGAVVPLAETGPPEPAPHR